MTERVKRSLSSRGVRIGPGDLPPGGGREGLDWEARRDLWYVSSKSHRYQPFCIYKTREDWISSGMYGCKNLPSCSCFSQINAGI